MFLSICNNSAKTGTELNEHKTLSIQSGAEFKHSAVHVGFVVKEICTGKEFTASILVYSCSMSTKGLLLYTEFSFNDAV